MNKIITVALIAGGLLLLDSPEAAAHKEVRVVYQPSTHYRVELRRSKNMPHWLKRDHSFKKWYQHTRLKRNRHIAWHRLFEIYRWERADARKHRRGAGYYDRYYASHYYDNRYRDNRVDYGHDARNDRRRRKH